MEVDGELSDPLWQESVFYYRAWQHLRTEVAPVPGGFSPVPHSRIVQYADRYHEDPELLMKFTWALDSEMGRIEMAKRPREETVD